MSILIRTLKSNTGVLGWQARTWLAVLGHLHPRQEDLVQTVGSVLPDQPNKEREREIKRGGIKRERERKRETENKFSSRDSKDSSSNSSTDSSSDGSDSSSEKVRQKVTLHKNPNPDRDCI